MQFNDGEYVEFNGNFHVVHGLMTAAQWPHKVVIIEKSRRSGLFGAVRTVDLSQHNVKSAVVARYNDCSVTRAHVIAPHGATLESAHHDEYVSLMTGSVWGLA